ncbi:MAG: hypothetical protein QOC92_3760 [Acidimicrobiaceae bacterium]|jgi:tetratricopeptide (TPR) repeat protein
MTSAADDHGAVLLERAAAHAAQGESAWRAGAWTDAAGAQRQALDLVAGTLGECVQTAIVAQNLAVTFKHLGRFDEAERLYRRALTIAEQAGHHRLIASICHNLGGLAHARGESPRGVPWARRSVSIRERLADDAIALAADRGALAGLLLDSGDVDEAVELLHAARQTFDEHGDELEVAIVDGNLAAAELRRGALNDAEAYARSALARKEAALGSSSPELAVTLTTLGTIRRQQGAPSGAVQLHQRALALLRPEAEADHPLVRAIEDNLAIAEAETTDVSPLNPKIRGVPMFDLQLRDRPHDRSAEMFRRIIVAVAVAVLAALVVAPGGTANAAQPGPSGDVIRTWNNLAFDTARQTIASDATAARLYAMVDVAMFDAVNGLAQHPRQYALVPPKNSSDGDPTAAAATAAHDVLVALYPTRAETYNAQLDHDLATVESPGQSKHGQAWGSQVAAVVVQDRLDDGSSSTETQPAGAGSGQFRSRWDSHNRHLQPFAISDPEIYVDAGPPALDSPEYAAAFNDVKAVGSNAPDPAASATFGYWKLSGGTNQPPGAWLQVAQTVSAARDLSLEDTARLFALESMALADTVAPTNETKHKYRYWRPETAIHEADPNTNSDTIPDPTWTGRAPIAGTPEHFSGHSSFSGAGAEILARFFCTDAIAFTLVSDSGGGVERSFPSFSSAAAEAGRSRVLGGQHFEFSNQAGLTAGRLIADEVIDTALQPVGHAVGTCPG